VCEYIYPLEKKKNCIQPRCLFFIASSITIIIFLGKKTSLLVFILHLSLVVEWWWHQSLVMNSLNLVLMNLDFVDIALCQGSLACYYCCWLLCTHFSLLGFFPLGFLGKVFNGIETEFSRSCGLGFGLIPQSAL
jgi:hypothetical protein